MKSKFLWSALFSALILGLSPFAIYKIFFSGQLSATNADWGSFGSFIGGFSSALLSTFSLIILIWTLHITMRNTRIQLDKQDENHIKQLTQQKELHDAQMLLQQTMHEAQLTAQDKAHNEERVATNFTINNQLIMSHIDSFNRITSGKKYKCYQINAKTFYELNIDQLNDYLLARLKDHFSTRTDENENPFFSVIKETRLSFKDELIPLVSMAGIITNEDNDKLRTNLTTVFLAGTSRETVLWPLCYAMINMPDFKDKILGNGHLLIMPERMSALQSQYGFQWTK